MNRKSGYPGHDSMREKAMKSFGHEMGCYKSGGSVCHKPVRRNMGGAMGVPDNTADSIQQANQLLSTAAANRTGIKRGGPVQHKANGGSLAAMGNRDLEVGRKAAGFNRGGDVVKKAMGGVAKIRHGQSSKMGMQLAPRNRHNGKS
jgi:hypothetical protein